MKGRPGKLPEGFEHIDFARLSKREKNGRVRVRLLGLAHLQDGKSQVEVAKIVKVKVQAVNIWIKRFAEKGLEGLQEQRGRGSKRRLLVSEEQRFKERVLALQQERKGGRIRGKDIQAVLAEEFETRVSINTVYNMLKRLNLVWISSRSKHPEAKLEDQEAFKKTLKAR